MKIIKSGNFTNFFQLLLMIVGVLMIIFAAYWVMDKTLQRLLCVAGLVLGMVGMYAGKASVFKLKPFTNDPLGWRKARAAYSEKVENVIKDDPS